MTTPPFTEQLRPTWTPQELLTCLGKLPAPDLIRFLKTDFPNEDLSGWTQEALVELSLNLLQEMEKTSVSPDAFLIHATSSLCRASFEAFVRMFWDEVPGSQPLLWNWHLSVFCQEAAGVAIAIFQRLPRPHDLAVNVSPGSSKSSIWSVLFPCWVWANMPEACLITASHTDSLVTDLASKSRDVMKDAMYRLLFPEVEFTETQDSKGHYRNTKGGERFTCTIGGKSPIGKHAHVVIIDDPIDPKKVLSEAERKTAADFMTKVIPTRRMRGAQGDVCVTILIMQRLGLQDPTDVMLETARHEGAAPLRHICLPAELTDAVSPPELRGFYEGLNIDGGCAADHVMDPIRFSRKVLNEQRAILGEWAYGGQFLQAPRPLMGGMFKAIWFSGPGRRVRAAPFNCKRIRYWDRACLVAGTRIETSRGEVPIEEVIKGDFVLTRNGYREVKWSGVTKKVSKLTQVIFKNGSVLVGTGDHPIWTINRYWVNMENLDESDCILYLDKKDGGRWQTRETQIWKQSNLMVSGMCESPVGDISRRCDGIPREGSTIATLSIEPSGDSTTETFLSNIRYITKIAIGTTTQLKISNVSRQKTAIESSERMCGPRCPIEDSLARSAGRLSKRSKIRQCTAPSYVLAAPMPRHNCISVLFARKSIIDEEVHYAVPQSVTNYYGKPDVPYVKNYDVPYVKNYSVKRNTHNDAAPRDVQDSSPSMVPVYDLEVEGDHEFFANGILVHNSSREESACFTAGTLLAYDGYRIFIEDCVHGKWEPDERNAVMLATAIKDRTRYGKHEPVIYVEAEGGSAGRDAWLGIVRTLMGFVVREDVVKGSKDTRAEPWATQLAAGNVFVVDNGESEGVGKAGWDINGYIEEHCNFRPETGKRLGKWKDRVDASCLVEGTLIETSEGSVPIELVEEGMQVFTRRGLRTVVWSGCSGHTNELVSVLFSNGRYLLGTFEHLILTQQRGFVKLGELTATDAIVDFASLGYHRCQQNQSGDNAWCVRNNSLEETNAAVVGVHQHVDGMCEEGKTNTRPSNSMESTIIENCPTENISGVVGNHCIGPYGNTTTEAYPVAIIFITKTKTHLTTQLKILNASPLANTENAIETSGKHPNTLNTWKELETKQVNGTRLQKGVNGTVSTVKNSGKGSARKSISAFNVGKSLHPNAKEHERGHPAIVRRYALTDIVIKKDVTKDTRRFVKNVDVSLWEANVLSFVAIHVQRHGNGKIAVYDLTVDGEHEFFANGILVHNSGAFNLLVGLKRAYLPLYTYAITPPTKNQARWLIACGKDDLGMMDLSEQRALVVFFQDPEQPADPIIVDGGSGKPSPHSVGVAHAVGGSLAVDRPLPPKLLGTLELTCADIDPADYQVNYGLPVEPWHKPVEDLQLSRDQAKKFWAHTLKKYDLPWQVLVLVDQGGEDRRALSAAMAVADMLRLPRSAIFLPTLDNKDELIEDGPPNQWIFDSLKSSRHLVVG